MNRIDRISAILIQLQTKRFVTAEEIAERFGLSRRTIYRDMKALEEAGVPLGAEPGKGFYLVEGYRLPPVMLSRDEAAALLTAEKMVEKLTDLSVSKHIQSAMFKIKSVLPEADKQYLSDLNANIEIFYKLRSEHPNNYISDIQFALAHKCTIRIDYQSIYKGELTCNRELEPVGLCFYSLGWHLIAFCRLRKEYRDFRIDRIVKLSVNKEENFATKRITIHEYFERHAHSDELNEVVVRFDKKAAPMLQNVKYYFGYIDELDLGSQIEMTFIAGDLNSFSRWLLSYADMVKIIAPGELVDIYKNLINKLLSVK